MVVAGDHFQTTSHAEGTGQREERPRTSAVRQGRMGRNGEDIETHTRSSG